MPTTKYFVYPFATSGDKTVVPVPVQVDGTVSYAIGYGPFYADQLGVDPNALPIDRSQNNQILFDITTALQQLQQWGYPNFITTADNLGTPFAYGVGAVVLYDPGTGLQPYESLIASNTNLPTVTSAWRPINASTGFFGISVKQLTPQPLPLSGAATIITWDTPDFDNSNGIITFTGPSTYKYTANKAGYFEVNCSLEAIDPGGSAGGSLDMELWINGSFDRVLNKAAFNVSNWGLSGISKFFLNQNDSIQILAINNTGLTVNTQSGSYFQLTYLGF